MMSCQCHVATQVFLSGIVFEIFLVANAQLGFESVLLHQLTKQVDNYLVQVY